ncbi:hypothetical protein [Methanocaldococcus sp.]
MKKFIFILSLILIPSLILASNVHLDIVPKECEVGDNVYLIIKLSKDVKEFKAKIESKNIYFPISYIELINDTDKVVIGKAINNGLGKVNITSYYIKGDNSTVIRYYTFKINIYTAKKVEEKTILKNVSKTNNITNNNSNTKINLTRINLSNNNSKANSLENVNVTKNNSQIIDNNPEGVGDYIFYGLLGLISGVIFGYTLTYIINIK